MSEIAQKIVERFALKKSVPIGVAKDIFSRLERFLEDGREGQKTPTLEVDDA